MQGKNRFTRGEMGQIRSLLREKERSPRSEQKSVRSRLRRLGFFITDFDRSYQGFTVIDLENLVRIGMVTIDEVGIVSR